MQTGLIYVHKNKINGKCYVGQTILPPQRRWKTDGRGYISQQKFYRAIQKYGWNEFEHIILEENIPEDQLQFRESYWIKYYDSVNNGYNVEDGMPGGHRSEETKQHIRNYWTPEKRKRKSLAMSGEGNSMYGTHRSGKDAPTKRAVVCIETGDKFFTAKEGAEWAHTGRHIFKALKDPSKHSAGRCPNGTPAHWRYATEEEIKELYG